jgi:hypothetical protein
MKKIALFIPLLTIQNVLLAQFAKEVSNFWVKDLNGIHNVSRNVGIGANSHSSYPLYVRQQNTGQGNSIAFFESNDSWHGSIGLKNITSKALFGFVVGGRRNNEVKPGNFGLFNATLTKWSIVVDGSTNYIGFGSPSIVTPLPKSTIHVMSGDINIEQIGSGIIMKSPNGKCWRITVDNSGNLQSTAINCDLQVN